MADLVDLSYAECRAALELASVGRVGVCTEDGPHVIPVNFTVLDESIVFRTSPFSLIATHLQGTLAFEVDELDATRQVGWSVLARGRARPIEDAAQLLRVRKLAQVSPWASGSRNLYIQLTWRTLTGRRIR